jgi:hypothetical protein
LENRPLSRGDPLTFYYPSTEWDMDQPFNCNCGAPGGVCKGWISGAKNMPPEDLEGYWLNDHITELLAKKNFDRQEDRAKQANPITVRA